MGFVIVSKDGLNYSCMATKGNWFKCGKCKRGNIVYKKGYKCRVCGAKVVLLRSAW